FDISFHDKVEAFQVRPVRFLHLRKYFLAHLIHLVIAIDSDLLHLELQKDSTCIDILSPCDHLSKDRKKNEPSDVQAEVLYQDLHEKQKSKGHDTGSIF